MFYFNCQCLSLAKLESVVYVRKVVYPSICLQ